MVRSRCGGRNGRSTAVAATASGGATTAPSAIAAAQGIAGTSAWATTATAAVVREPGDEHRERLGIAGDPQRPGVHRIEPHVANQAGGRFLAAPVIAAVHEARPRRLAPGFIDVEEHFARDGPESRHDAGLGDPL